MDLTAQAARQRTDEANARLSEEAQRRAATKFNDALALVQKVIQTACDNGSHYAECTFSPEKRPGRTGIEYGYSYADNLAITTNHCLVDALVEALSKADFTVSCRNNADGDAVIHINWKTVPIASLKDNKK